MSSLACVPFVLMLLISFHLRPTPSLHGCHFDCSVAGLPVASVGSRHLHHFHALLFPVFCFPLATSGWHMISFSLVSFSWMSVSSPIPSPPAPDCPSWRLHHAEADIDGHKLGGVKGAFPHLSVRGEVKTGLLI